MLCAIQELAESGDAQQKEHLAVLEYLKACNSIFETGILSQTPIKCSSSPVLKNMEVGYKYFSDWKDNVSESSMLFLQLVQSGLLNMYCIGNEYKFRDPKQKSFLAWQVHKMLLFYCMMLLLDLGLTTNHAFRFQRIVHRLP